MKTYEVVFDENNDKGVYALSCVENPAMEDKWIALEEHPKEIQFSAVDDEKRLLLGAALIPNKKVYRNMEGDEFYITFPEATIEACAHSFIKNGFQNNSSIDHEIELQGVSVVQSWIVEDPDKDKSALYGKRYDKGTWVTMMKVDNEEAWKKAKEGQLNGFSIDGLFSLKEINLNKSDMADNKNLIDTLKELFKSELKKSEVKMGSLKLKDGKTVIEFEGDAPEVGKPVFGLSDDKEKIRMPDGEHELETGEVLFVDKTGLAAEAPISDEITDADVEDAKRQLAELMEQFKSEITEEFEAKMSEMRKAHDKALKAEQDKTKELEAKLSKEPAEPKIVKMSEEITEPKNAKQRLLNVAMKALNN